MSAIDRFPDTLNTKTRTLLARTRLTPIADDAKPLAFCVREGIFRVVLPDRNGAEIVKSFLKPGDVGITPFRATPQSAQAVVEAVTNGVLEVAAMAAVERLARKNESFRQFVEQRFMEHYARKADALVDMRSLSARERYLKARQELGQWHERVPLVDIANYVGITPTHLSRIRRELGQEDSQPM